MRPVVSILFLFASAPSFAEAPSHLASPPDGWVDLRKELPKACFSIRYATADNFTKAPLPGYGAPGAWFRAEPTAGLKTAQSKLESEGLTFLVYDSYRPRRASMAMVAWAERTEQVDLLENGYIAPRSRHNHGTTIDLTIATLGSCEPLDMGTEWDTLSSASHTRSATGEPLTNRLKLKSLMEEAGFRPYSKEWWHFRNMMEGTKARDVPYGCGEDAEWKFKPAENWNQPGYVMPTSIPTTACSTD